MVSYEKSVYPCVVLYLNDARTTKAGIGRYLQIPNPNLDAVLSWADKNFIYEPGSWYQYTQYEHVRGPKIQVYGKDAETCQNMINTLKNLTLFEEESVYFNSPPRLVTPKERIGLYLVRATYFQDNRSKQSGRQTGRLIWEAV